MSSPLQRTRGCFPFSRSWRTACSRLLSSKLMLILGIVYVLHSSSHHQSQAKYIQVTGNGTYYTFNCINQTWCGENWSANRILRYGYNVSDELVLDKEVHVVHENNCSGAQDSLSCHSYTVVKNITGPRRVKNITRWPVPRISRMPTMSLYLITTDNINGASSTDKYPLNQDKIWQLRIPKNCKMTVYFSKFDLQRSDRCENDSFSVQTSKDQQDIYRYCNSLHRLELRRINRMQMTFHSDSVVARGGIKATACLSNLRNPVTETDLEKEMPCTCHLEPNARRRRKDSTMKASKALRRKIADEKISIARWLHKMMEGGQEAVDDILRDPESPKQRYLAEKYREVLSKHKEW